jgi:hypothetical protein
MIKNQTVLNIEAELKQIFAKDNIRRLDVVKSNELLDRWKILTNYKSDKTPVLNIASQQILDDDPIWSRNLNSKL